MTKLIFYSLTLGLVVFTTKTARATSYETIFAKTHLSLSGVTEVAEPEDDLGEKLPDAIIYQSISKDHSETITSNYDRKAWIEPSRQKHRRQMLEEFYFANTRLKSNTGRMNTACFIGNIESVLDFFANDKLNLEIDGVDQVKVSVSEDKKMMGIEYNVLNPHAEETVYRHFRMPHCIQGAKAPLLSLNVIKTAAKDKKAIDRMIANILKKESRKPNATGQSSNAAATDGIKYDGYTQQDIIVADVKAGFEKANKKTLPTFNIRANYAEFKPTDKSRPWVGKVGDIRIPGEAEKLSQIVLDYFYDSLLLDSKNLENNLIAQKSPADKSQWCHMPWLNVGEAGREAIHGLTKERDMEPTAIYPETQLSAFKKTGGSDWGIGFYNDVACASLNKIFGNYNGSKIEKPVPDFFQQLSLDQSSGELRNNLFPDGSASVKVLFTTADLVALKNSFIWTANTSLPKQTQRSLRSMRLVQIDVAIKDRKIVGTAPEADHWLMMTYYFDEKTADNYLFANSTLKKDPRFIKTGLSPFLKMRPVGIQYGFDPTTSRIFKGSITNTTTNEFHGFKPNLLNGPADNPTSSCLSCHAAAGTTTKMVPGVKDYAHYKNIRKKGTLDFSMQLAFAKRNYETRPQMTK